MTGLVHRPGTVAPGKQAHWSMLRHEGMLP
jgi:hypothetical protein